jgi:hypothetical protein
LAGSIEDYAGALTAAIEAALPGWVTGCVERVMRAWAGEVPPEVGRAAEEAGQTARTETGAAIRTLLAADIDEQRSTPLTLLRLAARYPTQVLRDAGVPPIERDPFKERAFPDDDYDLAPASLADVSPALTDLGITWGAAKAFEHKRRHRPPNP